MRSRLVGITFVALTIASSSALAQGQQSGALGGRVTSADRLPLPGVTITVTSPALQGARTTVTDINGVYSLPGLPPGAYALRFELSSMRTAEGRAEVVLGGIVTLDQQLEIAPVQESLEVRASTPAPVTSPAGAVNVRATHSNLLPVGRTPFLVAELAPGLTDNTPSQQQVTIGGGFAYDNVFLLNGVDINDNVLGQANALFIEEGIEEIQVLTSGISAEYGRFGGGVINVITRSGGNRAGGGFRVNLANSAWTRETPFERARNTTRASKLSPVYEGTLGGPIVRDRLWYFGGTRIERSTTSSAFAQTGIPYASSNDNARYEAKLTGTLAPGHTLQGTFLDNASDIVQPSIGSAIDPATIGPATTTNRLFAATWRGSFRSRTFATAQYSQKDWRLQIGENPSLAIQDSPFLTRGVLGVPGGLLYNAPYFDPTDPEQRNNRQFTGSVTHLLASPSWGTHELKSGFEHFTSTRVGGNSQSASGYVFSTDYRASGTSPALDAHGRLIPRFVPGSSRLATWFPVRGASIDVRTASLFVTDRWLAGPRLTLDLGARFERVTSEATGDISGADGSVLVPRLAASYALAADGRTTLQATYGHYSGKYNDVQFSRNSNVGNADRITGTYIGPAGEGREFAPGFDPANYQTFTGTFPTANVFYDDGLSSPLTREFTLSLAREIKRAGWARVSYVNRHATDFVEDFITIDGGQTIVNRSGASLGAFDNVWYRNSAEPKRDYQAFVLQAAYSATPALRAGGDWTVQIENDGTFEGESSSGPGLASIIGDYPEIYTSRSYPDGRLDDFQRHKLRLWATWSARLGRFGSVDLAPLFRYNSARTYSLTASVPLTAAQIARDPGYARRPTSQTIYFGERGAQYFEGYGLVDFAATYSVPVWQTVRPWVKIEVLNLLDNDTLIAWNTTVTADTAGAKDENGLPLEYITGAAFGTASGTTSYPRPRPGMDGGRTFLVSAGVRF
jgi:hypothetical protein